MQPPGQAERRASPRPARGGPGLGWTRPAPRSRRSSSATATATVSAVNTTGTRATHQRSPPNGRICWLQPIGESHDSHQGPAGEEMSPIARSTNDPASTPTATPRAARALAVSWAATAPTAANAAPAQAHDSPKAQAPRGIQPRRDEAQGGEQAEQEARAERQDQRRDQRGPAADHAGPQELGAALLLVAAGVPDHGEEHQDRDQHGTEGGHLQHGDAAEAGRVVDAPVEGDQRGRGVDRLARPPAEPPRSG